MFKKMGNTILIMLAGLVGFAQENMGVISINDDSNNHKIIPDKIFEIGLPLLFIFLLLNTIVTILKNRAERQLKLKIVEKGVSEDTLVKIFKETNVMARFQPLKWFFIILALAIASIVIHLFRNYLMNQTGYLAMGIYLLFIAMALFTYYKILSKKLNQ